jgi:hypothetical protein
VDWYPGCAGAAGQHLLPGRALPHPQGGKEVHPSSSLLLEGTVKLHFFFKKINYFCKSRYGTIYFVLNSNRKAFFQISLALKENSRLFGLRIWCLNSKKHSDDVSRGVFGHLLKGRKPIYNSGYSFKTAFYSFPHFRYLYTLLWIWIRSDPKLSTGSEKNYFRSGQLPIQY